MTSRLNIYFGSGKRGEELKAAFIEAIRMLGYSDASEFCQSIAEHKAGIAALLQQEYNGVDLDSITEFIKAVRQYNTSDLYRLISNKAVLDKALYGDLDDSTQ